MSGCIAVTQSYRSAFSAVDYRPLGRTKACAQQHRFLARRPSSKRGDPSARISPVCDSSGPSPFFPHAHGSSPCAVACPPLHGLRAQVVERQRLYETMRL